MPDQCIYRAQGSNINSFMDWMEQMFSKVRQCFSFVGVSMLIYKQRLE